MKSVSHWINQYNVFSKAQQLGIVFGPNDLNCEELEAFFIIKDALNKAEGGKNGK